MISEVSANQTVFACLMYKQEMKTNSPFVKPYKDTWNEVWILILKGVVYLQRMPQLFAVPKYYCKTSQPRGTYHQSNISAHLPSS